MRNKYSALFFFFGVLACVIHAEDTLANPWINLNGSGEVQVNEVSNLDGFSKATWNMWVKQDFYQPNTGLLGKYIARTGGRSYLIRTVLNNSTSIILSQNGTTIGSYTSTSNRACGIRNSNEWTMITITYNSSSLITYYRNGVKCDTDTTTLSSIYDSTTPVRFGAGNNIFLPGSIDEFIIYNETLAREQVLRLYNESQHGTNLGQSIPVLVYHRVEEFANESIIVKPQEFKKQMEFLKRNQFEAVNLHQYNNWRNGVYPMPKKAVIIIFDDGWASAYKTALPIMEEYGLRGSVAAVTDNVNGIIGGPAYMHWSELRNLTKKGWSIESHGKTHAHMLNLSLNEFTEQLLISKQNITQFIGEVPSSFIFPFHEANTTYTAVCGMYYELCWTQGSLKPTYNFKSTPGKEYLSLRRINIINDTSFEEFVSLLGRDVNKGGEWNMDEGVSNITNDTSGNSNSGQLLPGASWFISGLPNFTIKKEDVSSLIEEDQEIRMLEKLGLIIESDKGKKPMPLDLEEDWPDNMPIEQDTHFQPFDLQNESKK